MALVTGLAAIVVALAFVAGAVTWFVLLERLRKR